MKIAISKEIEFGEHRVAMAPTAVSRLVNQGLDVWVETGAGEDAFFSDADYSAVGASIIADPARLWSEADVLLKIRPPHHRDGYPEINWLKPGATLITFLNPLGAPELIQQLAERQVTAFSMEFIPRTSRAQSMDALSSQASLAGYKAMLLAAAALPGIFPMMTTAAGTIPPAKVLVIGAGVAGLQAIATARRLGAVVKAFDIRPAVKEEVQSLGANFIDISLEEETATVDGYAKAMTQTSQECIQQILTEHVQQSDIVVTTAQVPGKKAPLIVTEGMVDGMKAGSVIVDLAAEQGGNCAYTQSGRDICQPNGVTIMGPINLPATMSVQASQLYAKNLLALLKLLVKDNSLQLNFEDDIIESACVTHAGEIRNERVQAALLVSGPSR
ncbi:MAG: Re/Si-specific NAD(P)(+) transhydrogenase subunit alpha [Leptolyngbyaceae cyanobacterium MO_188.B28]|nr:Re/Si-specific NAD(P)(+) transhydrogenase subunit alpha [Leptolyngbyaceae cyanobacterium MO_188.B28]